MFWQFAILSACHLNNLPFCKLTILKTCHFMPICQLAILHFFKLSFCQTTILSNCHFVKLPSCHLAISSTCYHIKLSFYVLAILSTFHFVNFPFCQLSILSTYHSVNIPFCPIRRQSNMPLSHLDVSSTYTMALCHYIYLALFQLDILSKLNLSSLIDRCNFLATN